MAVQHTGHARARKALTPRAIYPSQLMADKTWLRSPTLLATKFGAPGCQITTCLIQRQQLSAAIVVTPNLACIPTLHNRPPCHTMQMGRLTNTQHPMTVGYYRTSTQEHPKHCITPRADGSPIFPYTPATYPTAMTKSTASAKPSAVSYQVTSII